MLHFDYKINIKKDVINNKNIYPEKIIKDTIIETYKNLFNKIILNKNYNKNNLSRIKNAEI